MAKGQYKNIAGKTVTIDTDPEIRKPGAKQAEAYPQKTESENLKDGQERRKSMLALKRGGLVKMGKAC